MRKVSPILLLFVASTLPAAPAPDEKPLGPAPRLLPAPQVDDSGGLTLRQTRTQHEAVVRKRVVVDPQTGKQIEITERVLVPVVVEVLHKFDAKDFAAYDLDGKKIEAKNLAEALKKNPLVVMSSDGNKVDPTYLKMFREGTVVLVLTAETLAKMDKDSQPTPPPPPPKD
jgi:hypothetical protein